MKALLQSINASAALLATWAGYPNERLTASCQRGVWFITRRNLDTGQVWSRRVGDAMSMRAYLDAHDANLRRLVHETIERTTETEVETA